MVDKEYIEREAAVQALNSEGITKNMEYGVIFHNGNVCLAIFDS